MGWDVAFPCLKKVPEQVVFALKWSARRLKINSLWMSSAQTALRGKSMFCARLGRIKSRVDTRALGISTSDVPIWIKWETSFFQIPLMFLFCILLPTKNQRKYKKVPVCANVHSRYPSKQQAEKCAHEASFQGLKSLVAVLRVTSNQILNISMKN